ncbi:12514_t:CDS:2 [Ambispora leptoticha]|uniref:12514_t:CDS:1 n=1 Tax=Ambispora leptoticha TaxID=144679 RepID=A0A9N9C0B3_9GLOM|nr:12514_t:CDS:2 [Ambispora leptoticha]
MFALHVFVYRYVLFSTLVGCVVAQLPTNSSLIEAHQYSPMASYSTIISSSGVIRSSITTNKPTIGVTSFIPTSNININSSISYSHTPTPTSSYSSIPSSSLTRAQLTQIPTNLINQTSIISSYVTASKTVNSNHKIRINLTGTKEIITPNADLFNRGEKNIDESLFNWWGILINLMKMTRYFFQQHSRVPYQSGNGVGAAGLLRNNFAPWKRELQQLGKNFAKYNQINVDRFLINNKNATIFPNFFEKPQYIQFRIQSITIDDDCFDRKTAFKTSSPSLGMGNLRYHYVKGSFGLFINENTVKILIPVEALDEIITSDLNSFVLSLKDDGGSLIKFKISDETFTNKKIAQSLEIAQSMKIVACKDTPSQKIDMTILHVDHEVKRRKSLDKEQQQLRNDTNATNRNGKNELDDEDEDGGDLLGSNGEVAFAGWSSILDPSLFNKKCDDEETIENNREIFDEDEVNGKPNTGTFIVKFHDSEEIRVFQFFKEVTFDEVKSVIQKTCGLQELHKLKCKDEVGEMITITNQYDFNTAVAFYATNNTLELWLTR